MTTTCPKCGQHYDVDQDYIGYTIDCETCGNQFLVKRPSRVPLSEARRAEHPSMTSESEQSECHPMANDTVQKQDATATVLQQAQPAMKPLVCEMCGSSDLMKTDGVFVCQSCGTKYSVEEAKKMMIAGTVNVTGTVKVDNTDKVGNLYKLARRAKESSDFPRAARYYEMILQENADSWEATFYSVYCRAYGCTIAGIRDAAMSLQGAIGNVISIVNAEIVDIKTQQEVCREISYRIVKLATMLFKASTNQYNGDGAQYQSDAAAISDMCLNAGNVLFAKHEQDGMSVNTASFLDLWKLSVSIRGDSGVGLAQRLKDIETIKRYDSKYDAPETGKMIWWGVARSIALVIIMYTVCWLFDWHLPHIVKWIVGYAGYESRKIF